MSDPNKVASERIARGFSTDYDRRKRQPVATGLLDYFPLALIAIAEVSFAGNEQHNPGEPLHWERTKSTDEANTALRHFMQRGSRDTDGTRHSAKAAWRMLALLEKEIEEDLDLDRPIPFEVVLPESPATPDRMRCHAPKAPAK